MTLWPWVRAQHGPGSGMPLTYPPCHKLQPRPQGSLWSLVASLAMDISTDTGCGRTMNSDMVLGSYPDSDVTMVPGGSAASGSSWPRHIATCGLPTWPQVAAQTTSLYMAHRGARRLRYQHRPLGYFRAPSPPLHKDLTFGNSPGPDIYSELGW